MGIAIPRPQKLSISKLLWVSRYCCLTSEKTTRIILCPNKHFWWLNTLLRFSYFMLGFSFLFFSLFLD
ncbi:hypothetical protein V6Z12_A01G114600 [Gossypium hirsutum]